MNKYNKQICIRIDEKHLVKLNNLVKESYKKRSEFIRDILLTGLDKLKLKKQVA